MVIGKLYMVVEKSKFRKFWRDGDPYIWLTGASLAVCLMMVFGLIALVCANGLAVFWPKTVYEFEMRDGSRLIGEIEKKELVPGAGEAERILVKRGNREIFGSDFVWVNQSEIQNTSAPRDITVFERLEWGNFFGRIAGFTGAGENEIHDSAEAKEKLSNELPKTLDLLDRIEKIQKKEIGRINYEQEKIRLDKKYYEAKNETHPRAQELDRQYDQWQGQFDDKAREIEVLREKLTHNVIVESASGRSNIPLKNIVSFYAPNRMNILEKTARYFGKIWEFVSTDPRESNTEGGVFPAIFGTVMMVMLMSIIVTPLGVIAAFYLREYAKQGPMVSLVRVAVNNLAGVPSIVFGVFGVGFFIYFVGGIIDKVFYSEMLPTPTYGTGGILWASLTLALLTVPVVIVATEEGLAAIPRGLREASYAVGATKFETTWRVVLPSVIPSIFTGVILAIARAAGEVAPLMITGVVKLAPSLPLDATAPFLHLDRKFMHLGFHIYDVGFQSPNVDAARPMVFTTTLLLIIIVVLLNLVAVILRNYYRKKLTVSAV